MKHLFIVNPVAGKGNGLKLIPRIIKIFEANPHELFIEITEEPGHGTILARDFCQTGKHRVYSVGGDGTLNEVLNGMAGSGSSLAVIPAGSGNDFIKSILQDKSMEDIIEKTIHGNEKAVDLAKVNGKYFINISSIGFDAEVVYTSQRLKKLPFIPGGFAYTLAIILTIFRSTSYNIQMTIDGETYNKRILLTAIANGRYYGGGMLPVPMAQIDDGLFDICMVDTLNRARIMALFPKYIKGTHSRLKEVSFHNCKKVSIKSDISFAINIDGEVERTKEAKYEILPGGIDLVIPE